MEDPYPFLPEVIHLPVHNHLALHCLQHFLSLHLVTLANQQQHLKHRARG